MEQRLFTANMYRLSPAFVYLREPYDRIPGVSALSMIPHSADLFDVSSGSHIFDRFLAALPINAAGSVGVRPAKGLKSIGRQRPAADSSGSLR